MKKIRNKGFTHISRACDRERGFTLIELLIVIAVLGTLAIVVLIALNPIQQLARTRDAGRLSTIAQLGHAMEAVGVTRGGQYPRSLGAAPFGCGGVTNGDWLTSCLIDGGEINILPDNTIGTYSTGVNNNTCDTTAGTRDENGYCYWSTNDREKFVIWVLAEAETNTNQCASGPVASWFVYSSAAGRGGLWCGGSGGNPPNPTNFNPDRFVQ